MHSLLQTTFPTLCNLCIDRLVAQLISKTRRALIKGSLSAQGAVRIRAIKKDTFRQFLCLIAMLIIEMVSGNFQIASELKLFQNH